MSSPLTQARVHFDADEARSSDIDLSGYVLRGIFSPDGAALGKIEMQTGLTRGDLDAGYVARVPLALTDNDEAATLLNIEKDWPLWLTTLSVEHPRVEPFDLFLLVEHRG